MKRFFYSGCSYTAYFYPTWGDIIAYDKVNHKGYNFAFNLGVSGGCNQAIASRLAWADKKYNFTLQDDIAVLWTTLFRESVLTTWFNEPHTKWHAYGNSFNNPLWSEVANQAYLHNTYNILNRNMTTFHYVDKLYNPFFQGRIGSNINQVDQTYEKLCKSDIVCELEYLTLDIALEKFYNDYLGLPRFDINFESSVYHKGVFSEHPSIKDHLAYALSVTDLEESTVEYFQKFHKDMSEIIDKICKDSQYYNHNKQNCKLQILEHCYDYTRQPEWKNVLGLDSHNVCYF